MSGTEYRELPIRWFISKWFSLWRSAIVGRNCGGGDGWWPM